MINLADIKDNIKSIRINKTSGNYEIVFKEGVLDPDINESIHSIEYTDIDRLTQDLQGLDLIIESISMILDDLRINPGKEIDIKI